jgi:hypothetical protein
VPIKKNEGHVKGIVVRCRAYTICFAREVEHQGSGNLTVCERWYFSVREQTQIPSRDRHTGDAFVENKGNPRVRSAKLCRRTQKRHPDYLRSVIA